MNSPHLVRGEQGGLARFDLHTSPASGRAFKATDYSAILSAVADPLSVTAVTTGAEALKHILTHLKGRWIRRATALTTLVKVLRETPRSGASYTLALDLNDALAATHALREAGEDENAKAGAKKAQEDALAHAKEAAKAAEGALKVTSKAIESAQGAAGPDNTGDAETYLKIALAAAEDPALAAAEKALIRHLDALHANKKDPDE